MSPGEFEHGYWYGAQLKDFAVHLGIPAANKLRKDELEKAILLFLRTGTATLPTTKRFIIEQAHRMAPDVRQRSGAWYWLNRWREEQITKGARPTCGDLVRRYIALNRAPRLDKIPIARYNNFVADFLRADKRATRAEIIAAWNALKTLDVPKDYASWIKARKR
jgi:SAP domain-containing new25